MLPRLACLSLSLLLASCALPSGGELPPLSPGEKLLLQDYPSDAVASEFFAKYVTVFGVYVLASAQTADDKVMHAARVMAVYLDNDQDGVADDPAVVASMVDERAAMIMFATEEEAESSGVFESAALDSFRGQGLWGDETAPVGQFDASLEEVLHLISDTGYAIAYPEAFSPEVGSQLADAMDLARGGQFFEVPESYPEEAWYHYDDVTCDYACMATEYFYWALTALLGAQAGPDRCEEISVEWELCTPETVATGDPAVYQLLTNSRYSLPMVLPDGRYRGD